VIEYEPRYPADLSGSRLGMPLSRERDQVNPLGP